MMTVLILANAAAIALVLIAFALDAPARFRDRRERARALADVEARVAELEALPPPSALPQARPPTKAEIRRQRGRRHPIAHKRRTGGWG